MKLDHKSNWTKLFELKFPEIKLDRIISVQFPRGQTIYYRINLIQCSTSRSGQKFNSPSAKLYRIILGQIPTSQMEHNYFKSNSHQPNRTKLL